MSSESSPRDTFSTIEDVEVQLVLAENRLASAQDEIRRLKEIKNTRFLPVSRLPPEVLSLVFEFLAVCERPKHFKLRDITQQWLPATQVCRHWRDVALNSPRLWSCIYLTAPVRWAGLQLARSKSVPLFFRSTLDYLRNDTVFDLMFDHATRVVEISVRDCTKGLLEEILHARLPSLETLSLSFPQVITERPHIALDLFPRLHHLKLKGCIFTVGPPLTHLRSLSIAGEYYQSHLTIAELLTALRQMSNLTSLELHHALSLPRPKFDSSPEPIPLPLLTHLSIKANVVLTFDILKYLHAPNVTSLNFVCSQTANLNPVISYMFAMLPQRAMSRSLAHIVMWYSRGILQSSIEVQIWGQSEDEVQPAFKDDPPWQPLFRLRLPGMGDLSTELGVCKLLPDADMSILEFSPHIQSQHELASQYALPFFREMRATQSLRVCSLGSLVLALSDGPKRPKRHQEPEPYSLPSLRHILVKSCHCTQGAHDMGLSNLKRLLEVRQRWGTAVEALEIEHPYGFMDQDILDPIAKVLPVQFLT